MFGDTGYVCVVRNKETKVYAFGASQDTKEIFKHLGVGEQNELVMNYWVINYYEQTLKLYKLFAKKRIPQSDYFKLTKKDLDEVRNILKSQEKYTDIVLKQDGDAFWLQKFKEKREKYSRAPELKKFFMRHNTKFNMAVSSGFFLLVLSPLVGIGLAFLSAIGISEYLFAAAYFGLFFILLWEGNKQDKFEQENLLGDEEEIIKRHQEFSKRVK